MAKLKQTLTVANYNDFRDMLPSSSLFSMMDCSVEIWCPEIAETSEVEKMTRLIESMVNVTDIKIGSSIEDMASSDYRVVITETSNDYRKRFPPA